MYFPVSVLAYKSTELMYNGLFVGSFVGLSCLNTISSYMGGPCPQRIYEICTWKSSLKDFQKEFPNKSFTLESNNNFQIKL